jgi:nucleoid DNA-binding protein
MPAKKAKTTRKATAKKTTARKTTAPKRKTTARKKAAPVSRKISAIKTAFTKSQLQTTIAESTELTKKQVAAVFEELASVIEGHIKSRGAGEFTLPGLLKVRVVRKPATKARKGVNPFTGEQMVFKAKPARNVVKIKPLKKLKEMVG